MAKPSAELVRHLFTYDPETGIFRWFHNPAGVTQGSRAGCVDIDPAGHKRRRIRVNGKQYPAAELAWLYMTGEWPTLSVDHKNLDGADDSWDNLRLATRSQQMMNRRSGGAEFPKGVSRSGNKYMARIQKEGMSIFLGCFPTIKEARQAYVAASAQYHGEFGRTH